MRVEAIVMSCAVLSREGCGLMLWLTTERKASGEEEKLERIGGTAGNISMGMMKVSLDLMKAIGTVELHQSSGSSCPFILQPVLLSLENGRRRHEGAVLGEGKGGRGGSV